MQQDKKYYDNFFTNYPVSVHDNPARFTAVSALLSGKVLDVACGTGTLADYYSGDYVGVDISDVAVRKAKASRRKNALFLASDFTRSIRLGVHDFDCVYVGEFLEHIESDEKVFDNILKHCRRTAKIFVSVPNADRVPDESHCRTFTVPEIRRKYSKYGKVRFHNWDGFAQRILFSIEIGAPDTDEISLVMIVKNEQKGIERAIVSALPIVDRVVVSVDTKTTDKTAEIAKLYADSLDYHIWTDNFSAARNFAQRKVKSRWILFLDGHEYIENFGNWPECLKSTDEGIMVSIRLENGTTFMFPRIYRSYIEFKGAVHNLNECRSTSNNPNFMIVHDRAGGQDKESAQQREKQRDEMLPRVMKERLKKDRKDLRALFHLGNYYMLLHDWKGASKAYRQYLKFGKSAEECYLMALNLALAFQMRGSLVRALFSAHRADRFQPGRWETARVYGGIYMAMRRWEKASRWLVMCFDGNKRRYLYEPFPRDDAQTWDLLGMCFTMQRKKNEAISAFTRAQKLVSTKEQKSYFSTKIQLAERL